MDHLPPIEALTSGAPLFASMLGTDAVNSVEWRYSGLKLMIERMSRLASWTP